MYAYMYNTCNTNEHIIGAHAAPNAAAAAPSPGVTFQ